MIQIVSGSAKFNAVLHRERSRADRLGDEFTLVLVHSTSGRSIPTEPLTGCLEWTDEIAQMDDGSIVLLFPHTSAQQAVEVLQSRFSDFLAGPDLAFARLTYPVDSLPIEMSQPAFDLNPDESATLPSESTPRTSGKAGLAGALLSLVSAIGSLVFHR